MVDQLEPVLNLRDHDRMLDVVKASMHRATDVRLSVAFTVCSGLQLLIDPLEELLRRKGRARILTSTYQQVTQPDALEALLALGAAGDLETRLQIGPTGFHTKFWHVADSQSATNWVGSSNLTKSGLSANIEWNQGTRDLGQIGRNLQLFDGLWSRPDTRPLSPQLIAQYRTEYEKALLSLPRVEEDSAGFFSPTEPQQTGLARLAALRADNKRRAAIIGATGIGKTMLAAFDVQQMGATSVLYVSHMKDHLEQAQRKAFWRLFSREQCGRVYDGWSEADRPFVFATVQSLASHPELLERRWDYLVIDEFHHVEAPTYLPLRAVRERAFLLGLTATPDRADGLDVLEWCDWNIALDVRLPEAIDNGWLIPFHYFGVADESVDFRDFMRRRIFSDPALERLLSTSQRATAVHKWARLYGFEGRKRVTVGFCAGVEHARFMAKAFNEIDGRQTAIAVDATSHTFEQRQAIYAQVQDPGSELTWLFVSDLLNEGVDLPAINSILFLRPTESPTIFLQQLGRGLRLYPGTEVLTVIDFVGHHLAAWNPLKGIASESGSGPRTEIAGQILRPPKECELVLQRRTEEILEKIRAMRPKREQYVELLRSFGNDLKRSPLPADLIGEPGAPDPTAIRKTFGSWLEALKAAKIAPEWAAALEESHPLARLLIALEKNWQTSRVWPYAYAWALAAKPESPTEGVAAFYERFPQWQVERGSSDADDGRSTVRKKLLGCLADDGQHLNTSVRVIGDAELLREVEGRLIPRLNADYFERHGAPLSTPERLVLFASYKRAEVIRHYGIAYDPAKHNEGVLELGQYRVLILDLDRSGAIEGHQYENRLVDELHVQWASQGKMSIESRAARDILGENPEATTHLFLRRDSRSEATFLGAVTAERESLKGTEPFQVTFRLPRPLPSDLARRLHPKTQKLTLESGEH